MSADSARRIILALLLLLAAPVYSAEDGAPVAVRLTGLSGELEDNVRAALGLASSRRGSDPDVLRELHDDAEADIRRALEPFGYYRPDIQTGLQRPGGPGGSWLASFDVDPGPPLPVAGVDIRFLGPGAGDPELASLAKAWPLPVGATLDHRLYESGKRELIDAVRERGYLAAAQALHRVEVDLTRYTATIQVHISTGPRFVFGAVEFQQDRFHPEYMARYLILESGQPFSTSELSRQRQVLARSGHFREVQIRQLPATADDPPAIPLQIALKPFKTNRFRGALGWGTDTGFGVRLDWTRRYAGQRGQNFTAGAESVEERNRLAGDLSYIIPLQPLDGSKLEIAARHESKDLTYDDVDLDEGGETRIETNLISGFWHRPRARWGPFTTETVLGLSYVEESYDIFEVLFGNLPDSTQKIIIERIGAEAYATLSPEFEAPIPNLRLTLRRSEDRLFIRDGDYLRLQLLGASEDLGANISFWQARLDSWHIRPLRENDRLLLRASLGYSDARSRDVLGVNFNQMPEYYEFRAGGARSVRGYGFEELFPDDAITGGKHQLVASIEYEREIIPDWSAAVFFDAGNAFNDFDNINPSHGVGFGVRWRSPVGLARIDLGFPLDDAEDSFQIYITVGPEF
jgi:translocation and assembly module TamA